MKNVEIILEIDRILLRLLGAAEEKRKTRRDAGQKAREFV